MAFTEFLFNAAFQRATSTDNYITCDWIGVYTSPFAEVHAQPISHLFLISMTIICRTCDGKPKLQDYNSLVNNSSDQAIGRLSTFMSLPCRPYRLPSYCVLLPYMSRRATMMQLLQSRYIRHAVATPTSQVPAMPPPSPPPCVS